MESGWPLPRKDTAIKTLLVTTVAFAALVMVAPVGVAHAGVCRDMWLPRVLAAPMNTPQRLAAATGWFSCVQNNLDNAYTPAELDAATEEYKEARNITTAGRALLAKH
jgi:hypothetical protein